MTLADVLRQAREAYGMSQAELARRSGVSKTAMNNIEKGYTPDPHFSHVCKMAHALHLSLDALAGDLEHPPARTRQEVRVGSR